MTDIPAFLNAMNAAVTGVHVVTTKTRGRPVGHTVSAMCLLSDEPPLLLVAICRNGPLAAAIAERGAFAVNVLADHQAALAETFRGTAPAFATRDWWPLAGGGVPLLHGAAARFECRVERTREAGTHMLVVGAVTRAQRGRGRPLAYTRRWYAAPLAA